MVIPSYMCTVCPTSFKPSYILKLQLILINSFYHVLKVFFSLVIIDSICRYVNDGRPFWQFIVSSSTGCSDAQYFEEVYNYYTTDKVRGGQSRIPLCIETMILD